MTMNIETITMNPGAARRRLAAYEAMISKGGPRATEEARQIRAAYLALARGKRIISLTDAFVRTGWDERGRPKLAIARADERRISGRVGWGDLLFEGLSHVQPESNRRIVIRLSALPPRPVDSSVTWRGTAIVPIVPPTAVPSRFDAREHHVLFEADWQDAPRDPYLLRHLGGDLWAVIAAWDLTEVERMVLRGRARQ